MARRSLAGNPYGYLYDPSTAIARALTPVAQDITTGIQEGLKERRARAEAEMESERLREVRDRYNAIVNTIETSKDPEEIARAREELNTTLSGYEYVPERPQNGKFGDWLAGVNREPRKLFTNQELATLDTEISTMDRNRRAAEEAKQQAEWEAELPYRTSGKYVAEYGHEPTSIDKNVSWNITEETRPGLEQQKIDISKQKAAGRGGAGGAGADETPPKQSDVRGFLGTFTKPLTTVEGYAAQVRPAVQDWVNKAVYDIATQPNYGSATNTADSWLNQVWGTDEEKKAATARLNAARSNLYNYYGKKSSTGSAEQGAIPAATADEIDLSKYHPR
jgi:hypothetical protein